MTSAHDVAAAVLELSGAITAKKMQKLVYYTQAWHLARHGEPAFDEDVEAWAEGPVVRSLWQQHRNSYLVSEWSWGSPRLLSPAQVQTVRWVVEKYGHFSAEALSRMTHAETPWLMARSLLPSGARSSEPIKHDHMKSFYGRQRVVPDVAVSLAAANSALEGVDLDNDWQDHLREVADGTRTAEDLIEQEIRRVSGK